MLSENRFDDTIWSLQNSNSLVSLAILTIAMRIMLPAFGQYVVGTLLDSSLASLLGAPEITGRSRNIIDLFFSTELWILVAATYAALAFPLSRLFALLERRYPVRL